MTVNEGSSKVETAGSPTESEPANVTAGKQRRRNRLFIAATVIIAVAVVITVAFAWSINQQGLQGTLSTISYSSFELSDSPPQGVSVINSTNTIYVNQSGVRLFIECTPPWANYSGDFFMAYGLVNPSFHMRPGLSVTLSLINPDDEQHNLIISGQSPPYQYAPMMSGGMMWSHHNWMYGSIMLNGISGNLSSSTHMPMLTMHIDLRNAGTYWYFCGYPRHAESGMYGSIVIA